MIKRPYTKLSASDLKAVADHIAEKAAKTSPTPTPDFIALVTFGGGGSWARDKDQATAIKRAVKIMKSDWSHLYKFKKGTEIKVNVYDVTGRDELIVGDDGVWDGNVRVERIDLVTVKL